MKKILLVNILNISLFSLAVADTQQATSERKTFNLPQSISGYPLKRQEDYTINGINYYMAKLQCHFTNETPHKQKINIWSEPDAKQPYLVINLNPGSKLKPFKQTTELQLRLFKPWWCGIYAPRGKASDLSYCAYFSVADDNTKQLRPFSIHPSPVDSTAVKYQCRIQPVANHPAGFLSRQTS